MRRSGSALVMLAALAMVTSCGGGNDEATVGGVTPEEAAQLNNAAEMLDASPDSLTAPEGMPLDTESNSEAEVGNGA